jgi:sugar phosphate isomerase/epimerase
MIRLCAFSDEAGSSIYSQIDALKRNNISLVELRSIDNKNVSDFSISEAKEYCRIFKENEIEVWSIGSPLGKVDINVDFNEYEKKIRHVFEISKIFNCNNIRMFSFFNAYNDKELVFKYLNKMVEIAKEYDVNLCHENEKDIYGDISERIIDIMNNVEGLRYIYDPANFIQCNEDSKKTIDLFFDKTFYFHIKDVIKETQELVPSGYGDGNIKEILKRIKEDIVLTIEPHLRVFDAYKSIDNSELKTRFEYKSSNEAFDVACKSIKDLLSELNYKEVKGGFIYE